MKVSSPACKAVLNVLIKMFDLCKADLLADGSSVYFIVFQMQPFFFFDAAAHLHSDHFPHTPHTPLLLFPI